MKIEQLEYRNRATGWHLNPITFTDLTLLVGASGVGKTQTLKAIWDIRQIARGESLNGIEWDISFRADNETIYRWYGKFEYLDEDKVNLRLFVEEDDERVGYKPRIVYEKLFVDDKLIIDRNEAEILFNGNKTPKLSSFESIIKILNQENDIAVVYDSFRKIIRSARVRLENEVYRTPVIKFNELLKKHKTLEGIQESDLPLQIQLVLAYENTPKTFEAIKNHFIDIFPQVEDIQIKPVRRKDSTIFDGASFFQIKEKGVETWIDQIQMSSGMLRSLIHISELYLCAAKTVILIDEFENSLGVNCIDILTELLSETRNQQFIITSHHPYIINNIGMEYWKIVTRTGSEVIAKDAKDFNLGHSRHDAFIQLINLEAFSEGIAT